MKLQNLLGIERVTRKKLVRVRVIQRALNINFI